MLCARIQGHMYTMFYRDRFLDVEVLGYLNNAPQIVLQITSSSNGSPNYIPIILYKHAFFPITWQLRGIGSLSRLINMPCEKWLHGCCSLPVMMKVWGWNRFKYLFLGWPVYSFCPFSYLIVCVFTVIFCLLCIISIFSLFDSVPFLYSEIYSFSRLLSFTSCLRKTSLSQDYKIYSCFLYLLLA